MDIKRIKKMRNRALRKKEKICWDLPDTSGKFQNIILTSLGAKAMAFTAAVLLFTPEAMEKVRESFEEMKKKDE